MYIGFSGAGSSAGKEQMKNHCESCGRENPATDEGYTTCCNENVCDGRHLNSFGNETKSVRACCWAVADTKFTAPEGSYRF